MSRALGLSAICALLLNVSTACDVPKDDTADNETGELDTQAPETADTNDTNDTGSSTAFSADLTTTLTGQNLEAATPFFVATSFDADVELYKTLGATMIYLRAAMYYIGMDEPMGIPLAEGKGFEAPDCWTVEAAGLNGTDQFAVALTDCQITDGSNIYVSGDFELTRSGVLTDADPVILDGAFDTINVAAWNDQEKVFDIQAELSGELVWNDAADQDIPDDALVSAYATASTVGTSVLDTRTLDLPDTVVDFDSAKSGELGVVLIFDWASQCTYYQSTGEIQTSTSLTAKDGVYASETEFSGDMMGVLDMFNDSPLDMHSVSLVSSETGTDALLSALWESTTGKSKGLTPDRLDLSDVHLTWNADSSDLLGNLRIEWKRFLYDADGNPFAIAIQNEDPEDLWLQGNSDGHLLQGEMWMTYQWDLEETDPHDKGQRVPDETFLLEVRAVHLAQGDALPDSGQLSISAPDEKPKSLKERAYTLSAEYHFGSYTPVSGWTILIKHRRSSKKVVASYHCNNLTNGETAELELTQDEVPSENESWEIEELCSPYEK